MWNIRWRRKRRKLRSLRQARCPVPIWLNSGPSRGIGGRRRVSWVIGESQTAVPIDGVATRTASRVASRPGGLSHLTLERGAARFAQVMPRHVPRRTDRVGEGRHAAIPLREVHAHDDFPPCVDAPVGASNFFGRVWAVRSSAVMCPASGCGMSCAAGLSGGTRVGSESFPRARRRDDENRFSRPRLDDRSPLPVPPVCPRLRRHPGLGRLVGRPLSERGPTPSSPPPTPSAPCGWRARRRRASRACAPTCA